ncbi:MAG TPA: cytochrome c oxidase accessory protein CcoG [Porticoccus sp.]|nr:cytochrome c oxidase accessory protein CcoG [Porticoccus sp.]
MSDDKKPLNQHDHAAHEETIKVLDLYQAREKIQTRKLPGFFRDLMRWTWMPMLSAFFLFPWINIGGRQAIWFDLPARKFHVAWITFWPQDFMLLSWALIIAAFALFTVTVLVGRVWCGFSCPQTVWTMLFISIEDFCEGDRNQRIKLDKSPWDFSKIKKRGSKLFLWGLLAFVTGLTFVGYFNPIRELVPGLLSFSAPPEAVFWTCFFAVMTYMNAGFLREQVCIYMCPYARFQSVMFDEDTLIVSYDVERGEPRGARKKSVDHLAEGKGDCVDCSLCVQVCPTGIDIRHGLQYECIDCGLCIDACNTVMDKMDYEPGLIRFTTERAMKHGKTHILRPRFIGYVVALTIMTGAFGYNIFTRMPLEVNIIRDRNVMFRESTMGLVENIYTLKINNMDTKDHRYSIRVEGDYEFSYRGAEQVTVVEGEVMSMPVSVALDPGLMKSPNVDVLFVVESVDDPAINATEVNRFIGPRLRR